MSIARSGARFQARCRTSCSSRSAAWPRGCARSTRIESGLPAHFDPECLARLLQPDLEVREALGSGRSQQLEVAVQLGIAGLALHQLPPAGERGELRRRGAHRHRQPVEPALALAQQCFGFLHVRIHHCLSAIIASVVSISDATDAAFCSACRLTLVGSITPASSRSSYLPFAALNPNAPLPSRTWFTTTLPSQPPLPAI